MNLLFVFGKTKNLLVIKFQIQFLFLKNEISLYILQKLPILLKKEDINTTLLNFPF